MTWRGFVGVPVPADPALVALLDEIAGLNADARAVSPTNLHFTLSFLGDVPDEARVPLGTALAEATSDVDGFEVELVNVGAFPNVRHPRVVWVGVRDPRPLVDLATRVRARLTAAGAPGDDKDFRAHITLARVRSQRGQRSLVDLLRRHGTDAFGTVEVREAHLYESVLSPSGPTYTTVATGTLGA